MKLDKLDIDEVDLVRALIRWGVNQVKEVPDQSANLRAKILPALPLIRFVGMSQEDVAKVCVQELGAVLTAEEQIKIMQSSLLKDKNLLPTSFTRSAARIKQIQIALPIPARSINQLFAMPPVVPLRKLHVANFTYDEWSGDGNYEIKPFSFRLEFTVGQSAKLVGLNLEAGTSEKTSEFFFTVFNSSYGDLLASGDSRKILDHSTGHCLKVCPEIILQPGCYYSIQFTFPLISYRSGLPRRKYHFVPQMLTSVNGWPKVTLTDDLDAFYPLRSLVFDVPPSKE
jgi:hypothetical protein